MRHRTERSLFLAATVAASLLLLRCGGSTPTSPAPPVMTGQLAFSDSGCACVPTPYPPIDVFIDGKLAGELPVFGKLTLTLSPGAHQWSIDSAAGPTSVVIQAGRTVSVHFFTNLGCDDCGDGTVPGSSTAPPVPRP